MQVGHFAYVAYGSNMHRGQMARRCPSAVFRGRVRIPGHLAFINGRGVAGIRAARPETAAIGVLWEADGAAMAALDQYEGVNAGLYRREQVRVETGGGWVVADTYIPEDDTFGVPHTGYQEILEEACMDLGVEPWYATSHAQWFLIDLDTGHERLLGAESEFGLVKRMRLADDPIRRHPTLEKFMAGYAAEIAAVTGRAVRSDSPEAFVRALEGIGVLRLAKRAGQCPILYWPAI